MIINTARYEQTHLRQPRGYGRWAFCPYGQYDNDDYIDHTVFYTGTFADAKKSAIAYFQPRGVTNIVVCP